MLVKITTYVSKHLSHSLVGYIYMLFFWCFCLQSLASVYCSGECCSFASHSLAQCLSTFHGLWPHSPFNWRIIIIVTFVFCNITAELAPEGDRGPRLRKPALACGNIFLVRLHSSINIINSSRSELYVQLSKPVATEGGHLGAVPPTFLLFPTNFLVPRKTCFKYIIKTKIMPP